jgi:Tfp pilus assembly protein FimT
VNTTDEKINALAVRTRASEAGRSVVETLMVVTIACILTSLAVPQILSARRMIRSSAIPREIAAQLRFTRQQAMSQRQAFTFQYDNSSKTVKIYDHNNNNNANPACNMTGLAVLTAGGYPNTPCSTTVNAVPLATGPVAMSDWSYGIPTGITNTTLDDGTTLTALTSSAVNITFQPDGTVVDATGNYAKPTLFFYNTNYQIETASAISVLGSAGRVKVWRYSTSAGKYAE